MRGKTVKEIIGSGKDILKKHWLFMVAILAAAVFLFWKCHFGFGNIDEAFYLTIPYRLFKGDALFLQEWHLSQMAGVITMPIVGGYVTLTGGTEGIVLFMRYVCTAAQVLTAIFLYVRLNKLSRMGALVASLSYVLYIPFGIMALSYNSIAIMALVIASVILITAQKRAALQYVIAGIIYALAVLCCPYLAVVFIAYLMAVAVILVINKCRKTNKTPDFLLFTPKGALFLTIGAAIAAVLFGVFVLSRASITDIIKAFPLIMDDPEHPPITLVGVTVNFFQAILNSTKLGKYIYPALALLFGICVADKKRTAHRMVYFISALACTVALMIGLFRMQYINLLMWPVNILGAFAALLSTQKTTKRFFWASWAMGMLYAFCLNATSNQTFLAIASAAAVSLVGSIVMIFLLLQEMTEKTEKPVWKKIAVASVSLVMVTQLGMQGILRYEAIFWETVGMTEQTERIDYGFNAGLYVTPRKYEIYNTVMENISVLEEYDAKKVLHLSLYTFCYLNGDYEMATYSAWLSGVNEHTIQRLKSYYELNPEKMPDVVCADVNYRDMAELFCTECGYKIDREGNVIILVKE